MKILFFLLFFVFNFNIKDVYTDLINLKEKDQENILNL